MKRMDNAAGGITLDEFLALPEDGYRDEVSRGRLVREPQPSDQHGKISVKLVTMLHDWLKEHPAGELRTHSGFRLTRMPLTIRGPDVAFIRHERLGTDLESPFFEGAPDLAIEIVSPANTASELQEKIGEYIDAGAHIVWVVYPKTRSVVVHEANGGIRMLSSGDTLTATALLPGFELRVERIFD